MNNRANPRRRRASQIRPRPPQPMRKQPARRWLKQLVALVITAGAVAGAITAVKALWPSDPEDSAEVSVQVLPQVLLTDYQQRLDSMRPHGFRRPMAQPTDAPTEDHPEPTDSQSTVRPTDQPTCAPEQGCEPTTESSGGVDEPTEPPPLTSTPTPGANRESGEEGFVQPSSGNPIDVDDAADLVAVGLRACVPAHEREGCKHALYALTASASVDEDGNEVPPEVAAEQVVKLLTDSRVSEEKEPIGALVTASVVLSGLRGRTAQLTWSMWPAGGGDRLNEGWFDSHLAYRLRPDTDHDTATVDLWVPLPTTAGPYVIDVDLHVDGIRVANTRSTQFE